MNSNLLRSWSQVGAALVLRHSSKYRKRNLVPRFKNNSSYPNRWINRELVTQADKQVDSYPGRHTNGQTAMETGQACRHRQTNRQVSRQKTLPDRQTDRLIRQPEDEWSQCKASRTKGYTRAERMPVDVRRRSLLIRIMSVLSLYTPFFCLKQTQLPGSGGDNPRQTNGILCCYSTQSLD